MPASLAVAVAALILVADSPGSLQLTLGESSASVTGVEPGGGVAWFSLSREPGAYSENLVLRADIGRDADADGRLSYDADSPIADKSVWVAVDLSTGEYGVSTPGGKAPRTGEVRGRGLGVARNFLEDEREEVEAMLVRPGEGAWILTAGDGSAADADRESDRSLRLSFADFRPVASSPASPDKLRKGDVLVLIDRLTMELIVNRLAN